MDRWIQWLNICQQITTNNPTPFAQTPTLICYALIEYMPAAMEFIIILFLLLLNGLFAMYEMAMISSSRARLEAMAQQGITQAELLIKLIKDPEKTLSTIQVGITLIGILSGIIGGVTVTQYVTPLLEKSALLAPHASTISYISVVTLITFLSLVIGELVPKTLALHNPERWALSLAPTIQLLSIIVWPFVKILSGTTSLVHKILGTSNQKERTLTEDELKFILHQGSSSGVIDEKETEMIREVFRFTEHRARDLMTHRNNLVSLYTDMQTKDALQIIDKSHHTSYLLMERTNANIIGVLDVHDLLTPLSEGNVNLSAIATPALYIPDSVSALNLLEIFRVEKKNFGVVVNEFGVLEGVITLHDLGESILGDLPSVGESQQQGIQVMADGSIQVAGEMLFGEFLDDLGILFYDDLQEQGFSTLSGMAMHCLKHVPKVGETFSYKSVVLKVLEMDGARVGKLEVFKDKSQA